MGSSGVKSDDLANSGTANSAAASYGGNAAGLYSSLAPAYSAMAFNPQGYGATNLAKMNTASQQSLGGSNAGVTGQAATTSGPSFWQLNKMVFSVRPDALIPVRGVF